MLRKNDQKRGCAAHWVEDEAKESVEDKVDIPQGGYIENNGLDWKPRYCILQADAYDYDTRLTYFFYSQPDVKKLLCRSLDMEPSFVVIYLEHGLHAHQRMPAVT